MASNNQTWRQTTKYGGRESNITENNQIWRQLTLENPWGHLWILLCLTPDDFTRQRGKCLGSPGLTRYGGKQPNMVAKNQIWPERTKDGDKEPNMAAKNKYGRIQ